jgi:hypothetical protein
MFIYYFSGENINLKQVESSQFISDADHKKCSHYHLCVVNILKKETFFDY